MKDFVQINYVDIDENESYKDIANIALNKCFEEEGLDNVNIYINIIFTNPEEIRKLNKEYRKIDKETDVLSFPMFQKEEIDELIKDKENKVTYCLGDVVVSIERVKEQAIEYGHGFERELAYMLVHGFYHLMGYDHMVDEDKKVMRAKEENILTKINITR